MNGTGFPVRVPARLQEPLAGGRVRCGTCARRCALQEGQAGWCGTREVRQGRLWVLTYGRVSSLSANPIEKKPLYHFYPGTLALTSGSWSCNFACPWCQNWEISKARSGPDRLMDPGEFVAEALRAGCRGTSISFNEPTLSLEWALHVFQAARRCVQPLYNTFVTNGYMTADALHLLADAGLDAMNVDLKGPDEVYRRYCDARAEPVWRTCELALQLKIHLEITTLVIPGVNDDPCQIREIAGHIVRRLGRSVPWHVTAYFPAYRFGAPPTPLATLERARETGREVGLEYVYLGNVEGPWAHTYCPSCQAVLIERRGLTIVRNRISPGQRCPECGHRIVGVGLGPT